jgi:AcrR family transcriptional regulator
VSVVGSFFNAGARVTSIPLRGTVALIDAGLAAEQRTRAALSAAAGRMALDALDAVLAGDAIERVLERIEATGVAQRIAERIIEDGIAEQIVALLLESEELWVLVDEIARSPSVTEAITHQSVGFVDQITDTVRDRSRDADSWVQSAARRFARRRKGGEGPKLTPLPDAKQP